MFNVLFPLFRQTYASALVYSITCENTVVEELEVSKLQYYLLFGNPYILNCVLWAIVLTNLTLKIHNFSFSSLSPKKQVRRPSLDDGRGGSSAIELIIVSNK
jgi:hypothetical protein